MFRATLICIFASFAATSLDARQPLPVGADSAAAVPGDAESATTPSITVTGEKDRRNRKICRREVTTGSIVPKTTCSTVGELEDRTASDVARIQAAKEQQRRRQDLQNTICVELGRC